MYVNIIPTLKLPLCYARTELCCVARSDGIETPHSARICSAMLRWEDSIAQNIYQAIHYQKYCTLCFFVFIYIPRILSLWPMTKDELITRYYILLLERRRPLLKIFWERSSLVQIYSPNTSTLYWVLSTEYTPSNALSCQSGLLSQSHIYLTGCTMTGLQRKLRHWFYLP